MFKYIFIILSILNLFSCRNKIANATINYDQNFAIATKDKNNAIIAIMIGGPTRNIFFNQKDIKFKIDNKTIDPKNLVKTSALLNTQVKSELDSFILGSLNRGKWEKETIQFNFKGLNVFIKEDEIVGLCLWLKSDRDIQVIYKGQIIDDLTKVEASKFLTKDYKTKKYFSVQ